MNESIAGHIVLAVCTVTQYRVFGFIRIFLCPGIIRYILDERVTHDSGKPEGLVVIIDIVVAHALKKHAEVEIIPFQAEVGTVCQSRAVAVSYLYAVVSIQVTVVVGVGKQEVAQFGTLVGSEIFRIPLYQLFNIIQVRLVANNAVYFQHVVLVDGFTFLNLVDSADGRDIALEFRHFVADEAHIETYRVGHFADFVAPVDVKVKTTVVYFTRILVGNGRGTVFQRHGE